MAVLALFENRCTHKNIYGFKEQDTRNILLSSLKLFEDLTLDVHMLYLEKFVEFCS